MSNLEVRIQCIQVYDGIIREKEVGIVLTFVESPPGLPLPPPPSLLLVQRLQAVKGSDLDQDSCKTFNL